MKQYIYIVLIASLFSCEVLEEPASSLVIEAYIYENKPIKNIKLFLVSPINSVGEEIPVSNAEVFIETDGVAYKLTESDRVGYYDLNLNLQVISGKTYGLTVRYNEVEIKGETTIPVSIDSLLVDKDTLFVNSPNDFIKATWTDSFNAWYLGVILRNDPTATDLPFNNFFSTPTQEPSIRIAPNDVQTLGSQQLILYGITKEYEELYRITSSTIGSSNAGNMTNAFGIFAGFSSDTITFITSSK